MKCRQLRKEHLRQLWYKPYSCNLAVFGCTCGVGLKLWTESVGLGGVGLERRTQSVGLGGVGLERRNQSVRLGGIGLERRALNRWNPGSNRLAAVLKLW